MNVPESTIKGFKLAMNGKNMLNGDADFTAPFKPIFGETCGR